MKQFKIRASAAGQIMGGNVGASASQLSNILAMDARDKPMTAKQKEKYDNDVIAWDNPQLPAGAKKYCDTWIKEQIYKRRKEFTSKYTDKGNFVEDWSIEWINTKNLTNYVKNEKFYSNEWMTGTPDIVGENIVIDVKNSYDFSTFPLFDKEITNTDYYYQLMVYMCLTERDWSDLIYTLNDLPHHLIEREARSQAYRQGGDWTDHFESCRDRFTYGDIDDNYKYKSFPLQIDNQIIEDIKTRVLMCREYIKIKVSEF